MLQKTIKTVPQNNFPDKIMLSTIYFNHVKYTSEATHLEEDMGDMITYD